MRNTACTGSTIDSITILSGDLFSEVLMLGAGGVLLIDSFDFVRSSIFSVSSPASVRSKRCKVMLGGFAMSFLAGLSLSGRKFGSRVEHRLEIEFGFGFSPRIPF